MQLPEGAHLAYIVFKEAWYADTPGLAERPPDINITASHEGNGGGVSWEFSIEEVDLGSHGSPVRLKMFSEAWEAFAQMPEFFAALTEGGANMTLATVKELCDSLGAVDETPRISPYRTASR